MTKNEKTKTTVYKTLHRKLKTISNRKEEKITENIFQPYSLGDYQMTIRVLTLQAHKLPCILVQFSQRLTIQQVCSRLYICFAFALKKHCIQPAFNYTCVDFV